MLKEFKWGIRLSVTRALFCDVLGGSNLSYLQVNLLVDKCDHVFIFNNESTGPEKAPTGTKCSYPSS